MKIWINTDVRLDVLCDRPGFAEASQVISGSLIRLFRDADLVR